MLSRRLELTSENDENHKNTASWTNKRDSALEVWMGVALMLTSVALVGIVLGILTAVLPLGPVTVLVVQRTLSGDPRGAMLVGLGRAPVEALYCALACFGVSALLSGSPKARAAVEIVGSLVLVVIGIWLALQRATPVAADTASDEGGALEKTETNEKQPRRGKWGSWSGVVISALNPTLILSWSAVVGIFIALLELRPTLADKITFPVALGVGIALGNALLVGLLRRYGDKVEQRVVTTIIRGMGALFFVLGCWNFVVATLRS